MTANGSPRRPRILVTGTTGQVGHDLLRTLATIGDVIPADRGVIDLCGPEAAIVDAVRRLAPDIVFNPAAYTAVDRAESDAAVAEQVNAIAPGVLARECARAGAWLVHYSTDYVFDGGGTRAWTEDDETGPLGVYGRTKLAGERAVAASGCRHLVLRTSWVYSLRGRNFLTTMYRLARERDELRVVDDQVGAPTTSLALAQAGAALAGRIRAGSAPEPGVYHMSCAGSVSWCGFARAIVARLPRIAEALGDPPPGAMPRVTAIRTEDYPTPAARPRNSVLDNGKLARATGIRLAAWEEALEALLLEPGIGAPRGHG